MCAYKVIKTIRKRKYLYLQTSYRQGGRVRTISKYLGPADYVPGPVGDIPPAPYKNTGASTPEEAKQRFIETLPHYHNEDRLPTENKDDNDTGKDRESTGTGEETGGN
jgi:L-ascorbate metabolism protein UlaG (beta-lactamase superfamily)